MSIAEAAVEVQGTATKDKAVDHPVIDSKIALNIFYNITEAWNLNDDETRTLLGLDGLTYLKWKREPEKATIDADKLDRLSYIFGIYKALHLLLPKSADQWVKCPNSASLFQGKPALDRMLSGDIDDLRVVRQYLDSQCG